MLAAWGMLALLAGPPELQEPADEAPVLALRWSAIAPCPSRAQLLEQIADQGLGPALGEWVPESDDRARLVVRVDVVPRGAVWRADLELTDADGRSLRSFEASNCEALGEAVALIVAVTLDPVAVTQALARREAAAAEPAPASAPAPAPARLPEREAEPEREREPEPAREDASASPTSTIDADPPEWPASLQVGFSLHGGAAYGPTPRGYGLVGGRVALLGPAWRLELGGRWITPRRGLDDTGLSARVDAWMVELRGCGVPRPGPVELPICVGFEAGVVRGRGLEPILNPTEARLSWLAPTLSVGLRWAPVERFAFGPEFGLVVPLTRGVFAAGEVEVERLASIGVRGLLELELRLP